MWTHLNWRDTQIERFWINTDATKVRARLVSGEEWWLSVQKLWHIRQEDGRSEFIVNLWKLIREEVPSKDDVYKILRHRKDDVVIALDTAVRDGFGWNVTKKGRD